MAQKVFISYRRDDSRYQARLIYDALTQVVPRDNVFMDVDLIPAGADFRNILRGWVEQCDTLLALIGPGWLSATDPNTGRIRLNDPDDFVRIEIATALERNITVVPVLLDGASIPDVAALPPDLAQLPYRNAENVDHSRFTDDVARLIRKLQLGVTSRDFLRDIQLGHLGRVKAMLEGGADVNAKDINANTGLHLAITQGFDDVANELNFSWRPTQCQRQRWQYCPTSRYRQRQ